MSNDLEERVDALEDEVKENHARTIEQDHRLFHVLRHLFIDRPSYPKGDPRRPASIKAVIYAFFSPVMVTATVGAGSGIFALILTLQQVDELREQNRVIRDQNSIVQLELMIAHINQRFADVYSRSTELDALLDRSGFRSQPPHPLIRSYPSTPTLEPNPPFYTSEDPPAQLARAEETVSAWYNDFADYRSELNMISRLHEQNVAQSLAIFFQIEAVEPEPVPPIVLCDLMLRYSALYEANRRHASTIARIRHRVDTQVWTPRMEVLRTYIAAGYDEVETILRHHDHLELHLNEEDRASERINGAYSMLYGAAELEEDWATEYCP